MSEFKTYVEKRKEIEAREVTHRETVTTSDGQVRSICEGQVVIRDPDLPGSQLYVMFKRDFEKAWCLKKGPQGKKRDDQPTTPTVNHS